MIALNVEGERKGPMYFGNTQTVGTCSLCGGPVQVPHVFWSVIPPVPTCADCGAVARRCGPVIDMEPRRTHTFTLTADTSEEARRRYRRQWQDLKICRC